MTELLDYSDIVFNTDESLLENDNNSVVFGWDTVESGFTNSPFLSGSTGSPLPIIPTPTPSGAPTTIGPYYYPYVGEIATYSSLRDRLGALVGTPIDGGDHCIRYIDTANMTDVITNRTTAINRVDTTTKNLTSSTTSVTGRNTSTYNFDVMCNSSSMSYKEFAVDGSNLYKMIQVPPKSTLFVNFVAQCKTFKISGNNVLSANTSGNFTIYISSTTAMTSSNTILSSGGGSILLPTGLIQQPLSTLALCRYSNTGTTPINTYIRLRAICTATNVKTGTSSTSNVPTGTPTTTWNVTGTYRLENDGDLVEGYDLVPLNACRTKDYNPKITLTRLGITQTTIAGVYGNYMPSARTMTTTAVLYDMDETMTTSSRTMTVSAVTSGSTTMILPATVSGTTSLKRTTYNSYANNQKLVLTFNLPNCIISATSSSILSYTRTLNYMMGATAHGLTYFTSGTCTQTMNRANAAGRILFTGSPQTIQHTFLLPPSLGDAIEYKAQMQVAGGVVANIGCSTAAVGEWEE